MDDRQVFYLAAAAVIGFGLLFAGIGILIRAISTSKARRRTARTTGRVVDVKRSTFRDMDGHRSVNWYPVVEFVDARGRIHTAEQSVTNNQYSIGEMAEVAYDPMDPEGNFIMMRDAKAPGAISLVFMIVGILIAISGVSVMVFAAPLVG